MTVLVACEFSGVVRDAFLSEGIDAISCDLLPTESEGPHIHGSVIPLLNKRWDMVIAHPPCTYLCNSGVRWLYKDGRKKNGRDHSRFLKMVSAVSFFRFILQTRCKHVAVENPKMHGHALVRVGERPLFSVHPWMFGDPFKKETFFWTKGLPALEPEILNEPSDAKDKCHRESPGPDRWKRRSVTYPGIARAMVEQWGSLLEDKEK